MNCQSSCLLVGHIIGTVLTLFCVKLIWVYSKLISHKNRKEKKW